MTGTSWQAAGTVRRTNRRGDATRQNMLDAALRALASGDRNAVSANFIAKQAGATWGAVKYQFGDIDGLWAEFLRYIGARRGEFYPIVETDDSLQARVARIIATLWSGLDTPDARAIDTLRLSLPRDRAELERAFPRTAGELSRWYDGWMRSCQEAFAGLDVDPARISHVAAFLPGAMRGINSERHLSTYSNMDEARHGLTQAITAYLQGESVPGL